MEQDLKLHPVALAAAVAAMLPSVVAAASSDYMTKEQEDQQILVLCVIAGIVLISPTIGIQMARSAISKMTAEDDDRFRGNTDPLFGRQKKQAELKARLEAEEKKKKNK